MKVLRGAPGLLLGALWLGYSTTACEAEEVVAQVDQPLAEVMAEALRDGVEADNPWIRAETLRLMALSGSPEWVATLRAGLQDAHPMVRVMAIEALLPAGDAEAQSVALTLLVQGDADAKSRLLDLFLSRGTTEFQAHASAMLLRDGAPEIRRSTLLQIREHGVAIEPALREQLIHDLDTRVADAAFGWLVTADPAAALDRVQTGLRSSDTDVRRRALEFSRHMATADLWPTMRAYLRAGDSQSRFAAECVLGQLGDPSVEEALRTVILTGSASDAALALRSISHIRTERAQTQVERQIHDPRQEVREAALDILLERQVPPSVVEPFLADEDPSLGTRALAWMIASDINWVVNRIERMLAIEENVIHVLRSLHEASDQPDKTALLSQLAPQLDALCDSPNVEISHLASRLRLQASTPPPLPSGAELWQPGRMYATTESLITTAGTEHGDFLAGAARHDLLMVRVAAAIAIRQLGPAFHGN
ncbi:MAG: HEAT repeat domain-containing protein [Myxococcales bacterium]|nr:HEAT repeat domain-containing protein [Myxococcales bacterium]